MDDRFGQAGGVVFDADGLLGFTEGHAAYAVYLAQTGYGEDGLLGGQGAEVVDDVDCGHSGMIAGRQLDADPLIAMWPG